VIHVGASAEQLRAAVQRRQGPGSSDGRFVTLRVCHRWPSESGRYAADSPRRSHAYAALRNACGCDDVAVTRSGVSCARPLGRVLGASWPGAIRWLESDLRSGQRRENRPNVLALALRRVVAVAWWDWHVPFKTPIVRNGPREVHASGTSRGPPVDQVHGRSRGGPGEAMGGPGASGGPGEVQGRSKGGPREVQGRAGFLSEGCPTPP
jgi:hypothetical protein